MIVASPAGPPGPAPPSPGAGGGVPPSPSGSPTTRPSDPSVPPAKSPGRGQGDNRGRPSPKASPEGRSADGSADLDRKAGDRGAGTAVRDGASPDGDGGSGGSAVRLNPAAGGDGTGGRSPRPPAVDTSPPAPLASGPAAGGGGLATPSSTGAVAGHPAGNAAAPPQAPPGGGGGTPHLPRNPRDTSSYTSASPKRRMKVPTPPEAGGSQQPLPAQQGHVHGGSGRSVRSAHSLPSRYRQPAGGSGAGGRNAPPVSSVASLHSIKDIGFARSGVGPGFAAAGGALAATPRSSGGRQAGGAGGSLNAGLARTSSPGVRAPAPPAQPPSPGALDDEEQYMFEQRLTRDELGVAVRKISSSGKAQLRYVKCVQVRPPSSSDYDDGTGGGVGGQLNLLPHGGGAPSASGSGLTIGSSGVSSGSKSKLALPYLDRPRTSSAAASDTVSVSSRSSTGSRFLDRVWSGRMPGRRPGFGKLPSAPSPLGSTLAGGLVTGGLSLAGSAGGGERDEGLLSPVATQDEYDPAGQDGPSHEGPRSLRALTWGKKNAVAVPLDRFVAVRKGRTTDRTVRNGSPSGRLLSLVTCVRENESLDIEAPTALDRDKFASAFARFLGVPLIEEEEGEKRQDAREGGRVGRPAARSAKKMIRTPSLTRQRKKLSAAVSEPGPPPSPGPGHAARAEDPPPAAADPVPQPSSAPRPAASRGADDRARTPSGGNLLPALTPGSDDADDELQFENVAPNGAAGPGGAGRATPRSKSKPAASSAAAASSAVSPSVDPLGMSESARRRINSEPSAGESMLEPRPPSASPAPPPPAAAAAGEDPPANDDDGASHVSSLTGGVDQEIVEELHQAIIELRSELDASRAEAARAVKVAEQAIQSAENCSSSDWNSTVTHKAAEAAAQAQKRSAEAIARARMAEERLASERKSSRFWRAQAQASEEEAGGLTTRSAVAEIRRAAMMEELAGERRRAARVFKSLRSEFREGERRHEAELEEAGARGRELEVELDQVKAELARVRAAEESKDAKRGPNTIRLSLRRSSRMGRSDHSPTPPKSERADDDRVASLRTEADSLRRELDLVRHASRDGVATLRKKSDEWSRQASRAVATSLAEADHLRVRLAAESAMRLKLLNELQDIRGTVRVYCRPRPATIGPSGGRGILSAPAHDVLVVNAEGASDSSCPPASFRYDRVFPPGAGQNEVFAELEESLISSLDGFNVTLLAFGQRGAGKTHSLVGGDGPRGVPEDGGDAQSPEVGQRHHHGVQMQAIRQLFTIAGHRTDRYRDALSMTIVEVHNEKLVDLVAGTSAGDERGEPIVCETRDGRGRERNGKRGGSEPPSSAGAAGGRLEIRTNIDGNTVVQGLRSVPIESFEDAREIWREAVSRRADRVRRRGEDVARHESRSSVITTVSITSVNVATGVGTEGRLQFVDMASSDLSSPAPSGGAGGAGDLVPGEEADGVEFASRSISALNDVVSARCQFDRSVPYRNSTLTHLLRDSLEADTKVLLLCCVSPDEADARHTVGALKFASRMQKVSIGKATKHCSGSKE